MKMLFTAIAASLAALFLFVSSARAEPDKAELQQLVDSYAEKRGFSGTVLIARRGTILVESSYGDADVEWDVPNVSTARYRIGSLSKPLTATLVMNLIEEGVLSLDGKLGGYLPDLYGKTPIADVTVAQLLNHTSGIKDLPGNYNDPWWQTTARLSFEPEVLAAEWIKPVLLQEPGTQWRYNNAGFILLGVVIERVTDQSYAENLNARIFGPAGMVDSGLFSESAVYPNFVQGYARTPQGNLEQPLRVDTSVLFSAAGIYSTARDLYRFDRALYGDGLLSSEARATMLSTKVDFPYGFGWGVEEWPMVDGSILSVAAHTGSIPGYQSYYLRSEANEDCVIVLNNTNQGSVVTAMGRDLMEVLNGKPPVPAKRSLEDLLVPVALNVGTPAMIAAYDSLGDARSEYDLGEGPLNRLGYKFLGLDQLEAAIAIFEWSAELYPDSANMHDSLGEAYRAAGRIDDAILSYEAALARDAASTSAKAALEEMRANGR